MAQSFIKEFKQHRNTNTLQEFLRSLGLNQKVIDSVTNDLNSRAPSLLTLLTMRCKQYLHVQEEQSVPTSLETLENQLANNMEIIKNTQENNRVIIRAMAGMMDRKSLQSTLFRHGLDPSNIPDLLS